MLTAGRADGLTEPVVGVLREAEDFVGLVALVGVGVLALVATPLERFPGVTVSAEGCFILGMSLVARSNDPIFCLLMMPTSETTGTSGGGSHHRYHVDNAIMHTDCVRHKNDLEEVYHYQGLGMERITDVVAWKERVDPMLRM